MAESATPPSRALPLGIRLLIALDRFARRFQGAVLVLVEELALAIVSPEQRDDITARIYSLDATYEPGGRRFEQGLFEWEAEAIAAAPFPGRGRILLGGAGGGREAFALATHGYEVVAFEPSPALAEAAARAAAKSPRVRMARGSYRDLVEAADHGTGVLAPLVTGKAFDAIVLGWGSFSHVLEDGERRDVLRATRAIAPAAPVLMSYLVLGKWKVSGARRRLRNFLGRISGRELPSEGDRFLPWSGYHRLTSDAEVDQLAAAAGYNVVWKRTQPYGHCLLMPQGR